MSAPNRNPTKTAQTKLQAKMSVSDPDVSSLPDEASCGQRAKRPRSDSDDNISCELSSFRAEIMNLLGSFTSSQNNRLDKLEERIKSIQEQNRNIHSTNQDIERAMNVLSVDIKAIENKITTLECERKTLENNFIYMEDKMDSLEISTYKTSVEIRNVPKITRESKNDLYTYTSKLCETLKLDIDQRDVRDVYRSPSRQDKASSSIVIELINTHTKTSLLSAVKKYNQDHPDNQLNSIHLGLPEIKQQIYISELLIPKMKRLLFLARDVAKTAKFSFAWSSNGRIFIKKAEGEPRIMIKNEKQLMELKKSENSIK